MCLTEIQEITLHRHAKTLFLQFTKQLKKELDEGTKEVVFKHMNKSSNPNHCYRVMTKDDEMDMTVESFYQSIPNKTEPGAINPITIDVAFQKKYSPTMDSETIMF